MANIPFAQYDPLGVVVTFRCPLFTIKILGFADGTMITAKRDEQAFTKKIGATGNAVRVKNRNKSGSFVFHLLPTAPENALLSQLHIIGESDVLTQSDVGEFMVRSRSDQARCHAVNAWLAKVTDMTYGKDLPTREWHFDCAELDIEAGQAFGI